MKNLIIITLILAMFACKKDDSSTTPSGTISDENIIKLVSGYYPKDGDTVFMPKTGGNIDIMFEPKPVIDTVAKYDRYKITWSLKPTFTDTSNIHWSFVNGNTLGNHQTGCTVHLSQLDLVKTNDFWWLISLPNTMYSTGIRHFYVKTY